MGKMIHIEPGEESLQERRKRLTESDAYLNAVQDLPYKQKQLVDLVLRYPQLPNKEIAKLAGYSDKTPTGPLFKAIDGPLKEAFAAIGITKGDLLSTYQDCLRATRIIVKEKRGPDGKLNGQFALIEVPDYKVRLEAFKLGVEIGDYMPAKKVKEDKNITFNVAGDPKEAARRLQKLHNDEIPAEYEVIDDAPVN